MGRVCLLLLFMHLSSPLGAAHAQPHWQVDEASVKFEITNAGFPVEGSFSGFEADLIFDPEHPERSSMQASVDAATVESGIALRNRHLRKRDYFDVSNHPRIRMESVQISRTGEGAYEGMFSLKIKDVAQEVTMPFTFVPVGRGGRLVGAFTIDRLDFGVGEESMILSNEVTISAELLISEIRKP